MDLKYLSDFIVDINKTNSLNDKKATIEKWFAKDSNKLVGHLLPIYRYDVQYYLTSDNIKKFPHLESENTHKNLDELLNDLSSRKLTGHSAIGSVNSFIKAHQEYKDLILKVIDKDIEARIDVSVINKATNDSIPTFDVALAKPYGDAINKNKPDFEKQDYLGSVKIDGCRLITVIDENGTVNCFSREGKPFLTLQKIIDDVKSLHLKSIVFDGEVCLIGKNGQDDFAGIMKEIRKKDHTITNVRYKIFDMLTLEEFNSGTSKRILSERLKGLTPITNLNKSHLQVLEQWKVSEEEFSKRQTEASNNGWEGLIIRRDTFYKNGRSYDLLKVKEMQDAEYIVENVKHDDFPYLQPNGQYVKEQVVSALVISHKGNSVDVGSGLSQEQRRLWKQNTKLIIGKTISVQFFEETMDSKTGKPSLRFPTLKHIYEGKRDV